MDDNSGGVGKHMHIISRPSLFLFAHLIQNLIFVQLRADCPSLGNIYTTTALSAHPIVQSEMHNIVGPITEQLTKCALKEEDIVMHVIQIRPHRPLRFDINIVWSHSLNHFLASSVQSN